MQELSMNILDIAQNSVRADATLIGISLEEADGMLTLAIADNGKGMDADMVQRVTDPFTTTRTTRKVGLGLPFLKMAAELTGGSMDIESKVGVGTTVTARFTAGHIDLAPLGDMGATISALVQTSPDIDFVYTRKINGRSFVFDTREVRDILEGVPLSEPAVAVFIREYITEHEDALLRPEPKEETESTGEA